MTVIRLYAAGPSGQLEDLQHGLGLEECGGVCPAPGDQIVSSWTEGDASIWVVSEQTSLS